MTCDRLTRTVIYWLSVPAVTDSTDSHLLVVRTCCNGQLKQIPRFGGHFNPKSLAVHTQQFSQMSMLPSGGCKQYFISRVNATAWGTTWLWQPFGFICFTTSRHKSHVFCVTPTMSKKSTILSFDQCASCRALAIELVPNSTYRSHKEPSWPSGIRAPASYEIRGVPEFYLPWLRVFVLPMTGR